MGCRSASLSKIGLLLSCHPVENDRMAALRPNLGHLCDGRIPLKAVACVPSGCEAYRSWHLCDKRRQKLELTFASTTYV